LQHSSFVFLNSFHYQFCLFVLIRGTVMVDIVRVNADTRHQRTRTVPLKEKERTRTTFMKHGKLSGSNYWSIFKFHLSNASIDWHTDNQGHWTVFSGLQKSTSFIYIRQREKGILSSQRFKVWLLLQFEKSHVLYFFFSAQACTCVLISYCFHLLHFI